MSLTESMVRTADRDIGRGRLTTSNLSRNREGMVVTRINTVLGVVVIIGMCQVHKIIYGFLLPLTVGSRAIKLLSAQRSLEIGHTNKIIAKYLLVKGPIRLDELPHLEFAVRSDLVSDDQYLPGTADVNEGEVDCKLANVWVHVGSLSFHITMAVASKLKDTVILGRDLGTEPFLELFAQATKYPVGSPQAHDVKVTRGQLQKARIEKTKGEEDEKRDEACPLNIFDFEDDMFCKDSVQVDVQAIPEQDSVEIPVPVLESVTGD